MREFFKGWRRKVGCVALVMAVFLAAVWRRSQTYADGFVLPVSSNMFGIISSLSSMEFFVAGFQSDEAASQWLSSGWQTTRIRRNWKGDVLDDETTVGIGDNRWVWGRFGFGMFENDTGGNHRLVAVIIPFWSLVVPVTLLSAFLILWKPRKKLSP